MQVNSDVELQLPGDIPDIGEINILFVEKMLNQRNAFSEPYFLLQCSL
jgi:hypothetical protein